MSVRKVELTRPPITTVASSAPMIPVSVSLAASGNRANVVVNAGHEDWAQSDATTFYQRVEDVIATLAELLDECEQDDGVGDDDADEQQEDPSSRTGLACGRL